MSVGMVMEMDMTIGGMMLLVARNHGAMLYYNITSVHQTATRSFMPPIRSKNPPAGSSSCRRPGRCENSKRRQRVAAAF